ncbi:MAG TPA: F0F1 ATP synthase subunit B [Candidatus Doudnabacteria bacterium]|nr:F0F1 ATP synthase subunit B [Candidatus Doudnabacteria bacterium]
MKNSLQYLIAAGLIASAVWTPNLATAASTVVDDPGLIGMFGINWKLFLAQLINFGIVLFILWKWVWKPVTENMEARTKKIEDSLLTAEKIEIEKQTFEEWKETQMKDAQIQATTIIAKAKTTAEQLKAETLEKTKQEQQAVLERSKQELEQQKLAVLQDAQSELANLVVSATENLLRKKLDSKTDQKLISESLKQMKN